MRDDDDLVEVSTDTVDGLFELFQAGPILCAEALIDDEGP